MQTTAFDVDSIVAVELANLESRIVVVDSVRETEEDKEIIPFNATIQKDENVSSVDLYYTSTYGSTPDECDITTAKARDSKTGEIDTSGNGQINIRIHVKEGYTIDSITATPIENFKNLKAPEETGAENTYRITKIKGDIIVAVTTKKISTPENENDDTTKEEQTQNGNSSQTNTNGSTTGNAGTNSTEKENEAENVEIVTKGDVVTTGKGKFKVTGGKAVEFISPKKSTQTTVTIPDTVVIKKKTYKVTSIAANAFKNNKKLKKVVIGKNITKIGKKAFYNCKKLKKVVVKTKKLTAKRVGSKAFKGTPKKAVMNTPKKKLKSYKKIFKKKGFKGKIK